MPNQTSKTLPSSRIDIGDVETDLCQSIIAGLGTYVNQKFVTNSDKTMKKISVALD